MRNVKLLFPLFLLLGLFITSCQDDDQFPGSESVANVTFAGRVIDESGNGLNGATVTAGGETALTDANGMFRLKPVRLPSGHAQITVSRNGYFEYSRPYIVKDNALQMVTLQMLAKTEVASFSAASATLVNVPGGPKLGFPANAVADAQGNAYNGEVRVAARYLDPTDPSLGLFVPGDMTAEDLADNEVFLATYGMVAVELSTPSGQKLNVAPGKTVELRMPIQAGQAANAPQSIPLWYYNVSSGHWEEEGSAQKNGNEYVGQVSHFSFWNCDAPFPLTQLRGRIWLDAQNQPLVSGLIRITMLSTGSSSFGFTDGAGHFGGCIPKDEPLLLELILPESCGSQVLYSQNIGPFSGPSTLPDIVIPATTQIPLLHVEGTIEGCSGQTISNGYVKLQFSPTIKYFLITNPDGTYDGYMVDCGGNLGDGTATGYDLTNLLESNPVNFTVSNGHANVSTIQVCNALDEYVQYELDGQQFTILDVRGDATNPITSIISTQDSTLTRIFFGFENNDQLGTFPMSFISVNGFNQDTQLPSSLTATLTQTGNIGDYLIGSFGGSFQSTGGIPHNITGSFRVKRE